MKPGAGTSWISKIKNFKEEISIQLWNRWEKVRARIFPFSSLIPPAFVCCSVLFDKESLEFLRSFLAYWTRNFNFKMCGSSFSCSTSPSPSHTQQLLLSCMAFVWMNPTIIYGSCFIAIHYSLLYFYFEEILQINLHTVIFLPTLRLYMLMILMMMMDHNSSFVIISFTHCQLFFLSFTIAGLSAYLLDCPSTIFYFILFSTVVEMQMQCMTLKQVEWNFFIICEEKEVNSILGWDVDLDAFFENDFRVILLLNFRNFEGMNRFWHNTDK